MAATFSLTTTGALEIQQRLGGLVEAFGDLKPLMQDFGVYLETATGLRFEDEEAPDGAKWQQSARAREDGGKTLTDTAQLKGSIHSIAGRDRVEVGSNKIYAGIHQFGGTIRAKSDRGLAFTLPGKLGFRRVMEVEMPARPFLGLSSEDEAELIALTEDHARDAMGGGA